MTKSQTKKNSSKKDKGFMKIHCSPYIKNKTISKKSCLTRDILEKVRKSYNAKNSKKQIKSTQKIKIWNELKKNIKNCNQEKCWLKEISDDNYRKTLENLLFVPVQPVSWKKNPNEWLSNIDIKKVMDQYAMAHSDFKFIGPTFIDYDAKIYESCIETEMCNFSISKLLNEKKTKIGIIFNLDKHTGPGTHWVSLFVDFEHGFIFYFDSVGNPIPVQIMKFVNIIMEQGKTLKTPIHFIFHQNHPMEHQYKDSECGMYSLFFIITMLSNEVNGKQIKDIKRKIEFFKKKRITDFSMQKMRDVYFSPF